MLTNAEDRIDPAWVERVVAGPLPLKSGRQADGRHRRLASDTETGQTQRHPACQVRHRQHDGCRTLRVKRAAGRKY